MVLGPRLFRTCCKISSRKKLGKKMNVADNLLISFLSDGEASAFLLLLLGSTVRFSVFDAIKLKQLLSNFAHWLTFRNGRV